MGDWNQTPGGWTPPPTPQQQPNSGGWAPQQPQSGFPDGGFNPQQPPYPQSPYQPAPRKSGLAIASLIMGVMGNIMPFIGGLIAVGLGIGGAAQVSKSAGLRTGMGMAVTGIVFGVLGVGFWGALLATGSLNDISTEIGTSGFSSTGTDGLQPGDCLDIPVEDTESFEGGVEDVVACDVPHGAEFAGRAQLPDADGAPYPGDDEVFSAGIELCLDVFVDHVGQELAQREDLDILVVYPLSLTWRAFNDREVLCFIDNVDRTPLTAPVTGN